MDNKTFDMMFNLRMTVKQMERLSRKAEKEQKKEEGKIKKAIQQKNVEAARIYAENAIRKKNESLNYLRMAARIDAVQARVQSAYAMKDLTKKMEGVTKALDKAMSSMDLEKVSQVMEKFESQFEDLDVRTSTLEESMSTATTLSTPQDQVENLMREVAAEAALDIDDQLMELNPTTSSIRSEASGSTEKEDVLSRRLAALRQ